MPLEEDLIYPAFYLLPTQIIQVMVQLLLVRQNPCLLVVADHLHFLFIALQVEVLACLMHLILSTVLMEEAEAAEQLQDPEH